MDIEARHLVENQRQVLLGAGIIVIPRRAEAAAARDTQVSAPPESYERETSIVRCGAAVRAARIELPHATRKHAQRDCERGAQPSAHAPLYLDQHG